MSRLRRIAVVGTSASGKTTLARSIAEITGHAHHEMDHLFWGPEWTPVPDDVFRSRVVDVAAKDDWVMDGNYSRVREQVWERAQTVVWLNLSFPVVFWRAVSRTLRRTFTNEVLFAGNRERALAVFHPDWIPWWVARTYWLRRWRYPAIFAQERFQHLQVVELRRRRDVTDFLAHLRRVA